MHPTIARLLAVLLAPTLFLTACCDSDDGDSKCAATTTPAQTAAAVPATPAATSAAAVATPTAPAGPQVIEITAGEEGSGFYMRPGEVRVRPGAVTIKLVNAGPMRPHNVVVRTKAGDADLAESARANAGESTTLEFTVSETGTYELYCSLPGHKDRGARGTLIVQSS